MVTLCKDVSTCQGQDENNIDDNYHHHHQCYNAPYNHTPDNLSHQCLDKYHQFSHHHSAHPSTEHTPAPDKTPPYLGTLW